MEAKTLREQWIDIAMNSEKKPLREWAVELGQPTHDMMFDELYYPDHKPITKWRAEYVLANWNGTPAPDDSMDAEVEVELTITAKVKVTAGFRVGAMEQLARFSAQDAWNDELIAKMMVFASVNPSIHQDNQWYDDFWDGVGNMRGHIRKMQLTYEE